MVKVKRNEYVEEQGTVLEVDTYPATLKGFGEMEGQYGPQMIWRFDVLADNGEIVEAAGFTSYSMADGKKRSNLIVWSEAIMGELPDEFDTDDLIGMPCRVDIENYTKANGITKNKVVKVKPPKKGQKATKVGLADKPNDDAVDFNEDDYDDIPF